MNKADNIITAFIEKDPIGFLNYLQEYNKEEVIEYLSILPMKQLAILINKMSPELSGKLIDNLPTDISLKLLNNTDIKKFTHILKKTNAHTQATILNNVPAIKREVYYQLYKYNVMDVGNWMLPASFKVVEEDTTEEIIKLVKSGFYKSNMIYITSSIGILVGMAYINNVLKYKNTAIKDIMQPISYKINVDQSIYSVENHNGWLEYESLPVIDRKKQFIGFLRHLDLRRALGSVNSREPLKNPENKSDNIIGTYFTTLSQLIDLVYSKDN